MIVASIGYVTPLGDSREAFFNGINCYYRGNTLVKER